MAPVPLPSSSSLAALFLSETCSSSSPALLGALPPPSWAGDTLSQPVAVCRDLHMLQLQFRAGPQPDRVVSVLEAARLPLEAWLLFPKMFLMRSCAQTAAG